MTIPYFTIELVKRDRDDNKRLLLTKVFGSWRKAEAEFKYFVSLYPLDRIELNHTDWVNTSLGFSPIMAYSN